MPLLQSAITDINHTVCHTYTPEIQGENVGHRCLQEQLRLPTETT